MVTDKQVRMLMKLIKTEKTQNLATSKAGMDEKTARKYLYIFLDKINENWKR